VPLERPGTLNITVADGLSTNMATSLSCSVCGCAFPPSSLLLDTLRSTMAPTSDYGATTPLCVQIRDLPLPGLSDAVGRQPGSRAPGCRTNRKSPSSAWVLVTLWFPVPNNQVEVEE
jgi:hypothetical protein